MKVYMQKGFTLVEVLIAMFILSIGILSVVSMLVTSLRANSLSRATTVANQVVQEQMEQVKSMTFNTTTQKMCDGSTAGFILPCTYPAKFLFNNRTTTEVLAKYKASSTDLSNVTYDMIMQSVKNYPVTDVDMITGKAQWTDWAGTHKVVAVTYMER